MKSGINRILFFLLLILLSAFYSKAFALSMSGDINSESAYLQLFTDVKDQLANPDSTDPVKKNATPAIFLTILPDPGNRIAQLNWSSTDYTIPGTYYVERLDPSGWVVIKQLPYDTILVYNDTISFPYCTPTNISYQIRFISILDNVTSSTATINLSDQTSPAEVQNLVVNINTSGSPILTWTPVSGDDILGYRIQRFNETTKIWDAIPGLVLSNSDFYIDQNTNACDKSFRYVVSTIDKCNNSSEEHAYNDIAVQTINLVPSHPGQCDKFSNLVWNSYIHMPGGLGGYKIYKSDGSPAKLINDTQDTNYVDNGTFIDGLTYTYYVQAYSNNNLYSSSSCPKGWLYNGAILPDTVYITQVSIENNSYIKVGYDFKPLESVVKLFLERSDDNGLTFHTIDSILSPVPGKYYFIDSTADFNTKSYFYRLQAIDNCGYTTQSINTSQSIFLDCATSATQNTLIWNKYEHWLEGVKGYDVYRILNQESATVKLLDGVDQTTVSFTDPLSSYDPAKAACYWVEATENPGNTHLLNAISKSNMCYIIKDPILFIPNAFRPDGINKLFRPVPEFLYVDKQSFNMIIFSRWGQQLYETTNIDTGWDGKINGQPAPGGQYSYIITYKSLEDKDYTKRGTVLLVR